MMILTSMLAQYYYQHQKWQIQKSRSKTQRSADD